MRNGYMSKPAWLNMAVRLLCERPYLSNRRLQSLGHVHAHAVSKLPYDVTFAAAAARKLLGISGCALRGQTKARTATVDWPTYINACRAAGLQPAYPCPNINYVVPTGWTGDALPVWPVTVRTAALIFSVRKDRHYKASEGFTWRARQVGTGQNVWTGHAHDIAEAQVKAGIALGAATEPAALGAALGWMERAALGAATEPAEPEPAATEPAEPEPAATEPAEPEPAEPAQSDPDARTDRRAAFIEALASLAWEGMADHAIQSITITPADIEFEARVVTTVRGGIKRTQG